MLVIDILGFYYVVDVYFCVFYFCDFVLFDVVFYFVSLLFDVDEGVVFVELFF